MDSSESEVNEQSLIERLISSRNRDLSLFLPIILGITNNSNMSSNPDQDSSETDDPHDLRDRIILFNPSTQGMVVIEGSSSSIDSLLRDLLSKSGQPPASKASIEAMPGVEIRVGEEGECVICLEDWGVGDLAKEMPCKHKFHGGCIEKWLKIHGSCPVCRYKMPIDEVDVNKSCFGSGAGEERGGRRREIWLSFSFNSDIDRSRRDTNQTESNDSPSAPDHEM